MKVSQFMVIQRLLGVALQKKPDADEHFYAPIVAEFKEETKRLIECLPRLISTRDKHQSLSAYCRLRQEELLTSVHDVMACMPVEEHQHLKRFNDVYTSTDWFKEICNCLEEMVLAMQEHLAPYMSMEKMLPDSYQEDAAAGMKENMKLIKNKLDNAGVAPEFWNIISQQLNHLVSTGSSGDDVTAPKLGYLRRLYDELTELLTRDDDKVLDALLEILLYMNFNDRRCRLYIKDWITARLLDIEILSDRRMELYRMRKIISQASVRKHTYFDAKGPELKRELKRFAENEIIHLEAYMAMREKDHLPADVLFLRTFNLFVSGSDHELGHLTELLLDTGYILNQNGTDVTRFLAFYCRTTGETKLNPASLNRKRYTPRDSAVQSVREGLIHLSKHKLKEKKKK